MAGYELKKRQQIKPDLYKLIKHLTDFKEDEPEFKQCENFALSHFLHHTYLSVNRHQVQRSMKGLINKFFVHGFNDKAKRLEMLVDKFVGSERFKNHEEVDIEWSILLLLMNLSDNPTSMVLQEDINMLPSLPSLKEEENSKEPFIDWGKYLKEGYEKFELADDEVDSIVWSELESDEGEEHDEEKNSSFSKSYDATAISHLPHNLSSSVSNLFENKNIQSVEDHFKPIESIPDSDQDSLLKKCEERIANENWLKQNIQYDWWNDSSIRVEPTSCHPSARFAISWEEHENKHTQGLIPLGSTLLLSEYKVIRETLWILQVPNNTFLFSLTDDGKVLTKERIAIPSLTSESLAAYLNSNVCCYAAMIYDITCFIDDIERGEFEMKKPPLTYQSYADALHKLILSFFADINGVEQKVEKQETSFTLVSVIEDLRPSLNKLRYIYNLHKTGAYDWRRCEGWFCNVRLLASLYEDVYTSWKNDFAIIAMELFVKSFKVYLQIIDIWLSEGKLEDWRDEFIIKRYEGDFKVVSYADVLKEIKKTRIIEIFQAVEKAGSDLEHIKKLDEVSALTTKVENKGCLFKEFLEQLGSTLSKFIPEKHCDYEKKSLISNADELKGVLSKPCYNAQGSSLSYQPTFALSASELDAVWYDMATKNLLNSPWLAMSFKKSFEFEKSSSMKKTTDEFSDVFCGSFAIYVGTLPLHHIIEHNIISLCLKRQRIASKIMISTLLEKFKLLQHLAVLGSVYVLEASYIIQRFYNRLFSPDILNNIETAEYSLNILLEECIELIVPADLASNIQFSVSFSENQNLNSLKIIDLINIDYEVELPLCLIITKDCLEIYNSVFKFLLKIERALTSLHQLRFSDIKDNPNQLQVRQLYKLRIFLMHCITILHSYFVAYTPRELRAELECAISQACSVDDIIIAHNTYLQKLRKHCLLEDDSVIMKPVKKLLVISENFSICWIKQSQSNLSTDELTELDDEYIKAHVNLHIVLKITVGQHSNSPLRLLSADIERCLPVPALSLTGRGDQSFEDK